MEQAVDLKNPDFLENEDVLVFKYSIENARFDMIYHKDKDKVMVLRNELPMRLEELSAKELEAYKQALDICICYHHDKENEALH